MDPFVEISRAEPGLLVDKFPHSLPPSLERARMWSHSTGSALSLTGIGPQHPLNASPVLASASQRELQEEVSGFFFNWIFIIFFKLKYKVYIDKHIS